MKNAYLNLKNKHQEEVNNFPMIFAFNDQQFKEGMAKLGLDENDTDKISRVCGGGIIRKTDWNDYNEMFCRYEEELQRSVDNDQTGEGFIYDMFYYELSNHEYGYTGDVEDTLHALGLVYSDIKVNKNLENGLILACRSINEED